MTKVMPLPPADTLPVNPPIVRARAPRIHLRLATKLALALVGLVTIVLLINGAVSLWLNYGEAKRAAVQVQQEKASGAAERVDTFISEIESQVGWTARAEWRSVPLEQQRYDFNRLLRQAPAITEVAHLDPAGKELLRVSRLEPNVVGSGKDFAADPRFTGAIADKVWFGPVYFRRGSEPYMTVAVAHAGRNPGVTVSEVNLKLIWDVVSAIRVGAKGYAFVVTSTGRLIAHPDLSLVLRDTDMSRLPQVAQALTPDDASAGPAASTPEITTGTDGGSVLSAHASIRRLGWIVFVQLPLSEALAPVYASLVQTLALLALGLLLATVAGTFLARRLVVPIRRLQQGAERFGGGDLTQRIAIRTGDEIEILADRFNIMAGRVQDAYETLEAKVEERTRDLNRSLDDLHKAQDHLVQSEKLAALGQLVAGVAHEINTPLGLALTTSTAFDENLAQLRRSVTSGQVRRSELIRSIDRLTEGSTLVFSNLTRAADLVHNFKQVATDQAAGDRRTFDVHNWLVELMSTLGPLLRRKGHELKLTCTDGIILDTYPGALAQVVSNLALNAVIHAFPDGCGGSISIDVARLGQTHVRMILRDDGLGIPKENLRRLFDPFFTTRRDKGSSGLGLHIVYNLVHSTLQGRIEVESAESSGTKVTIDLPTTLLSEGIRLGPER